MSRAILRALLVGALIAGLFAPLPAVPAAAAALPSGFQEQIVFGNLTQPTDLEFAPDGRVFVAEKGGRVKVFDDLADTSPTVFADLSTNVHNQWDRGLLGLALPPDFPATPWVYVIYTYDAPPGQTAPVYNDDCSAVPGGTNGGRCVVTGRLSKLQAAGNVMTGSEQVLLHDWCQQYASHSIGDLAFGADGMLYATGGDGASFGVVDHGNLPAGSPTNPCADPANEGGALRSQDLRTPSDPTSLDGALLRLNPDSGAAAPGNPLIGSADLNARRIVATGLRNPYRLTMRPGTSEAWISETGWGTWEEVNRVANPTAAVTNFGWPCYEGVPRQPGYDGANLPVCESLYAAGAGAVAGPYLAWSHSSKVVPNETCPTGSSSSTGIAFYPGSGGPYPAAYRGAAFFADYSRNCIWAALPTTAGGLPSASNLVTFVSSAASPVDLEVGPGGELYYVDITGGTIRRVRYFPGNQPPTANLSASPTAGEAPLAVHFNATGSTDPDPADDGRLTYRWDFTNDGTTDSTAANPTFTYSAAGTYTAKLTVTDTLGATDTDTVTITPGSNRPTAVIDTPTAGTTWRVGQTIGFSGRASDPQQGTLPASALTWRLRMQHCSAPTTCHTHFLQDWSGVASGSFVAPDHEYPSHLELELVATDQGGLTHSVVRRLDPRTVVLTFASNPSGLQLAVGSSAQATPFTRTVIQGSTNSVSAVSPQSLRGLTYTFGSWSDGGAQTHVITAPTGDTAYVASLAGPAWSIGLRARVNSLYVAAEAAGAKPLIANRTAIGPWEQFDQVDAGSGFVGLRSRANGKYVTAEAAGAQPLIANRTSIGPWERFRLIHNADASISLQANVNGKYVSADNAGASPLIANRTAIGPWEKFDRYAVPKVVSLQATGVGRYVTAANATTPLTATPTSIGPAERFDLVDAGNFTVALRAHSTNLYASAEAAGAQPLIARSTSIGRWERFTTVENPDGTVSLLALANGKYVTAQSGSPLIASATAIGATEKFRVVH